MKTVAVLGGVGYIGSHLLKLLSKEDVNVKVLDLGLFGIDHLTDLFNKHKNIQYIQGDIRHAEDLAAVIDGADSVIHLAGLVGDPACSLDEDVTWLHNMESSQIIADICNYYKVKRLIYSSSCSVYGASPSGMMLNEGSYLNPLSCYARTKIDSEKILLKEFDGCTTVLRLATAFGWSPRMRFDLVANIFAIRTVMEGLIEVFGGKQYRPFIQCHDAARSFKHILDYPNEDHIKQEIFNVSCESISIDKLGELFGDLILNTKIKITDKKEDDRNYKVDASKIQWLLGFKPYFDLRGGILDMIAKIVDYKYEDWKDNNKYYNHLLGC